jgi:phage gpG-like protein
MNLKIDIVGDKELALYLGKLAKKVSNSKPMLSEISKHLRDEAKEKLGKYYKSWPKLKRSSVIAKYRRRALKGTRVNGGSNKSFGIGADDPLILFGKLKKSIMAEVRGDEAVAYTDNEYSAVHEYGYKHVPARSYMRTTLHDEEEKIMDIVNDKISKDI